ncbi:hypothetical protein SteCoe_22145 [Stentor coeruleus]|uniref:EF-hand domain-containing protein n=1 Tax=Stentor coeruleus TaxID=5963 RepID=A0A1R2BMZ5_9CILI|nr:hypothetical protein SteCoe_22145 [Stentor coeruleus]
MADLSAEEVQRVKDLLNSFYVNGDSSVVAELFGIIDRDGSGSLEADELEPIITAVTGKQLGAGELEAIIKAADEDGNSTIELNEFEGLLNNAQVKALLT